MLGVNHIKVDRNFKEFHKLAAPLLFGHISATLKVSHKQELIEGILMVTLMLGEISSSFQQLNTRINQVNQSLVPDRITVATLNFALAEQVLIIQILVEHHKQEVIQIDSIKVMVDQEKAFNEAQLDSRAYQLESHVLAWFGQAFLELAYLNHIKVTLIWLSSSKPTTIVKSVAFNLPSSQLLLLPFRYVLFLCPFKEIFI